VTSKKDRWTVLELLDSTSQFFGAKNIENPRLNAERLLADVLKLDRVQLYLDFQRPVTTQELQQFRSVVQRRATHEPLQYILGRTEFMSLPFAVDQRVLIPRPETEILVESVLNRCRQLGEEKSISILDIGTGSGCIAVSLAKYIENCHITAIDVSAAALQVAEENARRNDTMEKIRFVKMDFRSFLQSQTDSPTFDIVVSNPPYVSTGEFEKLPPEVRDYEPGIALHDGADGLRFYRDIAQLAPRALAAHGTVLVEVGLGQAEAVKELFRLSKLSRIRSESDLNGIERIVCAENASND